MDSACRRVGAFVLALFIVTSCDNEFLFSSRPTVRMTELSIPTNQDLVSVQYVGGALVVGNRTGQLFVSDDLGLNWEIVSQVPGGTQLNRFDFFNNQVGFACTTSGLYFTENGGQEWLLVLDNYNVKKVAPVNSTDIIAVGSDGLTGSILRSANGGLDWSLVDSSPTCEVFNAVSFRTSLEGYAVGGNSCIYTTNDGGLSWTADRSDIPELSLNDVLVGEVSRGPRPPISFTVMVANRGVVLSDARADSGVEESFDFKLEAVDVRRDFGVIVGENSVLMSNVALSKTWAYYYAPDGSTFPYHFLDVVVVDDFQFIAVGRNGVISKFDRPI